MPADYFPGRSRGWLLKFLLSIHPPGLSEETELTGDILNLGNRWIDIAKVYDELYNKEDKNAAQYQLDKLHLFEKMIADNLDLMVRCKLKHHPRDDALTLVVGDAAKAAIVEAMEGWREEIGRQRAEIDRMRRELNSAIKDVAAMARRLNMGKPSSKPVTEIERNGTARSGSTS